MMSGFLQTYAFGLLIQSIAIVLSIRGSLLFQAYLYGASGAKQRRWMLRILIGLILYPVLLFITSSAFEEVGLLLGSFCRWPTP